MNTTFDVLVIILSCLLAIFLIISIVIVFMALKLIGSIKRIVAKGEQVIDSAEAATEMLKKASAPVGTVRSILNIIESVNRHSRSK